MGIVASLFNNDTLNIGTQGISVSGFKDQMLVFLDSAGHSHTHLRRSGVICPCNVAKGYSFMD